MKSNSDSGPFFRQAFTTIIMGGKFTSSHKLAKNCRRGNEIEIACLSLKLEVELLGMTLS